MRLSHQIEQFIALQGKTSVRRLAEYFDVSEQRCREELAWVAPYGIELTPDGQVYARSED